MRILIMDDEDSIRKVLVELIEDFSSDVCEVANGIEGLNLLREKRFDLMISDYHMPKMDGLEMLRCCRADRIRIPTIWLSGKDQPEIESYGWQFGVYDYFDKPFNVAEFRKSVEEVKNLPAEIKRDFFSDYSSDIFKIPFETIIQKIPKATLKNFFEWCKLQKISPKEMVKKLLETL